VPIAEIPSSPLAPGVSPVRIHYRDIGAGRPLVVLHGGWGYEIYPFDRQIDALARDHRIVIPDRTGYGQSGRLAAQEVDFHQRAAEETFAVIDALGLDRPVLWGHSDGAVISLLMGLAYPDRLAALIVEATHLYRNKPASRAFFDTMMRDPDGLGERVAGVLAREHGESWRDLIRINGVAWRRIADERSISNEDLYRGRLSQLHVPTLVIHGAKDPRTEPGELDALRASLPSARFAIIAEGGHSPHSERLTADEVTDVARRFLSEHEPTRPAPPDPPAAPDLPGPRDLPDPP
jgi:pimeloyl-ACP methyl ester carboxylesterase